MKKKIFLITISMLLILCNFTPALASVGSTPSGIPLSKMEEKIDEYVNKHIGKTTPGAAVGVVKDGKVVFSKGYGYRDIENKIPVDPKTTVFEYGSTSKLFIWISVMQLVEQGKINLDEDIKKYLPSDFASNLKYKKTITMRNLMTHTAGFEERIFDITCSKPELTIPLEEALIKQQPNQIYEPGTIPAYSNYGSALAGYIVEKVSNEKFSTYEEKNIFSKLNMKGVFSNPSVSDTEKLKSIKAKGYKISGDGGFKNREWFNISLYPAGSVNGTLEDLEKFAIALTSKDEKGMNLFKSKSTLNGILSPSSAVYTSTNHGFLEFNGESYTLGHGGNTGGFSAEFAVVPSESFGVVVLTNAEGEMDITRGILKLLAGEKNKETLINKGESNTPLLNTKEVKGQYIISRRSESTFGKILPYLSTVKIKALSENEIEMSYMGGKASYVQTNPRCFKLIETPTTKGIFKLYMSELYFDMKEGKINYLSVGSVMCYTPLSNLSIPWLIFSITIIATSGAYFIISPFALFIQKLINKKQKREFSKENIVYKRIYTGLNICGTVTLLNNAMLIIRFMGDIIIPSHSLNIHLILNWVLLGFTIILIGLLIANYKKASISKKQKIFSVSTIIFITLLFWIAISWNLLSIIS